MSKIIIGIHGLANKPPKDELKQGWIAAIQEGLAKTQGIGEAQFDYDMVYWADRLYKHPQHNDEDFDFDDLFNTQPYTESEAELRPYSASLLDRSRIAASGLLGGASDMFRDTLGLDGVADWILERRLKDLNFYYARDRKIQNGKDPSELEVARKVLKDRLMDALLPHKGKSIMLIAHSMGSIIAYDVLRDIGRQDAEFEVEEFVTIGSPLGLPHVKGKIIEERSYSGEESERLRSPTVVTKNWINYWDRRDAVAIDGHLQDDFGANARGVRVIDDLVENTYTGLGGEANYHKSYGYLRAPELSKHIAEFLAG